MIDSYSQRIDWDSIAKTAAPAMQPDRNGTWVKLADHRRIVLEMEADVKHKDAYYAQFDLVPKATSETKP